MFCISIGLDVIISFRNLTEQLELLYCLAIRGPYVNMIHFLNDYHQKIKLVVWEAAKTVISNFLTDYR